MFRIIISIHDIRRLYPVLLCIGFAVYSLLIISMHTKQKNGTKNHVFNTFVCAHVSYFY